MPLVIPKLENADWRQQILAKRKKTYIPDESLGTPAEVVEEQTKEVGFGLQIKKKTKLEKDVGSTSSDTSVNITVTAEMTEVIEEKEETLEEMAARKIIEGNLPLSE
jgi:hypothetical protein